MERKSQTPVKSPLLWALCVAATIVLSLTAFGSLGFLSGWFIGASNSPMAGSIIASTFTLAGLVLTVVIGLKQPKEKAVSNLDVILPLASFVSSGIILFSVACWFGVSSGVRTKTHSYASFFELLATAEIKQAKLSSHDRWKLHLIYWELQSKGRSRQVIEEFFATTIKDVLESRERIDAEGKLNLDDEVEKILSQLQHVAPVKTLIAEEPFDDGPLRNRTTMIP